MSSVRAAAVYVRISDDKAADAAGVGRQEADCRSLAERHGWTVAEVYTENDTSAYKRRKVQLPDGSTALRVVRPGFRRMLDDLSGGAVDALVAYDLDRIARDPRDLEDLIDVVKARGIPTAAVTGEINLSTDSGVFMARMLVNVANKSSADTARRVVRKQLELAEQGKHKGGGIRAYGYARDGVTVVDQEVDVVRDIARRLLDGDSLRAVAAILNEQGVPTVRGGAWTTRSVHTVVTKPRNAGLRVHRGEIVGQAQWPAILDRETWERVLLILDDRARGSNGSFVRWLTRILLCSHCDGPLFGGTGDATRKRGPRYWCAPHKGGCGRTTVDALKAEGVVERMLLAYIVRPDVLADLRAATSGKAADGARADLVGDQEQLRELASIWAARQITTPEYMTARKEIEQRLERSQALVRASLPGAVRELVGSDLERTWVAFTPAKRREVARAVFPSGIRVDPSRRVHGMQVFDPERLVPLDWQLGGSAPPAA